jgi:hypothetical protein
MRPLPDPHYHHRFSAYKVSGCSTSSASLCGMSIGRGFGIDLRLRQMIRSSGRIERVVHALLEVQREDASRAWDSRH